jgi:hypothetical protein
MQNVMGIGAGNLANRKHAIQKKTQNPKSKSKLAVGVMTHGPQTDARPVTLTSIMHSPAFHAGVADARAGRPAPFDAHPAFEYERGRQCAMGAPGTVALFIGRRLRLLHIWDDIS